MTTEALVQSIITAGDRLAEATRDEMELEEQRPLIKADAINRLMQHGVATSATAAEKVVEKDPEYAAHRALQVKAVVARIKAEAYLAATKARAALALPEEIVTLESRPMAFQG